MMPHDEEDEEEQGPDLFGGPDETGRLMAPDEAAEFVGVAEARFKQLVQQHGVARREVADHDPQWVYAEMDLEPLKRWLAEQPRQEPSPSPARPE